MEEFVSSIFYKSVQGFRDVFSCPQSSRFELSAGSCKGKFICLFDPLRRTFYKDGEILYLRNQAFKSYLLICVYVNSPEAALSGTCNGTPDKYFLIGVFTPLSSRIAIGISSLMIF